MSSKSEKAKANKRRQITSKKYLENYDRIFKNEIKSRKTDKQTRSADKTKPENS